MRTGNIQDYNLALSGGSNTANYYVSGSYFKNKGPVIDNLFERGSLRVNTSGKRGRFSFGENMLLSYTHDNPIAADIFTTAPLSTLVFPGCTSKMNGAGF